MEYPKFGIARPSSNSPHLNPTLSTNNEVKSAMILRKETAVLNFQKKNPIQKLTLLCKLKRSYFLKTQ